MARHNLPFTLGSTVYELDDEMRAALKAHASRPETVALWFEESTLHHRYRTEDGRTTESVDVIATFETMPDNAKSTLATLGCSPSGCSNAHAIVDEADASLFVDVREQR